jgi:hypothetical protein
MFLGEQTTLFHRALDDVLPKVLIPNPFVPLFKSGPPEAHKTL